LVFGIASQQIAVGPPSGEPAPVALAPVRMLAGFVSEE
jgi:hypothetical protein